MARIAFKQAEVERLLRAAKAVGYPSPSVEKRPDGSLVIAVEKLNIKGLAGGMLAREVHDVSWGRFNQMLRYKAERAGGRVVEVDPRFTSQICPECGQVAKKKLSQRTHSCDCGCVLDRDVAAAKVILSRAGNSPGARNVAECGKRALRKICEAA